MVDDPERADTKPDTPPSTKDIVNGLAGFLALAALALYGIQYAGVTSFYAAFDGMTTEQVGLDQTTMITRLATALLLIAAVTVFVILIAPIVGAVIVSVFHPLLTWVDLLPRAFTEWIRSRLARFSHTLAVPVLLSVIPGSAFVFMMGGDSVAPWWAWLLVGMVVALVWLLGAVRVPGRYRVLYRAMVVLALTGLWTGIGVAEVMAEAGKRATQTGELGLAPQLLGVRWQYVQVELDASAGSETIGFPGILLGTSGGVHVLYDCREHEVSFSAVADVRITTTSQWAVRSWCSEG